MNNHDTIQGIITGIIMRIKYNECMHVRYMRVRVGKH